VTGSEINTELSVAVIIIIYAAVCQRSWRASLGRGFCGDPGVGGRLKVAGEIRLAKVSGVVVTVLFWLAIWLVAGLLVGLFVGRFMWVSGGKR